MARPQQGTVKLRLDIDNGALYAEHYEHRFDHPAELRRGTAAAEHPQLRALAQHFDALKTEPAPYQTARLLRADLAEQLQDAGATGAGAGAELLRLDQRGRLRRLHGLLERQHYRLASWRTAGDDINWRRFFDINEAGRPARRAAGEETTPRSSS